MMSISNSVLLYCKYKKGKVNCEYMSSGQTLGVKAQRFRGHTSPHRNVKEKKYNSPKLNSQDCSQYCVVSQIRYFRGYRLKCRLNKMKFQKTTVNKVLFNLTYLDFYVTEKNENKIVHDVYQQFCFIILQIQKRKSKL
eukprot:TRINITY_DN5721_c0_g1_i8.p6 TRINITY_DN5721_c0_g1~~TRINITY_DN5721_c0_g1_i8.p6  ORF type:complete len:138 (+),score=1.72 TRINITY_DN5721_c0_g1_i8:2789-3202(+)